MTSLVPNEILNLRQKRWRAQSRYPVLTSIDANRAMLAGMIHLEHDFAGASGWSETPMIHGCA
ncbi:MAG: hypothetical protein V4499_00820 [Pseudomonadota bacterium]